MFKCILILISFILLLWTPSVVDYRAYYEEVNQAELYIVKNEFSKALIIYKMIFNQYNNHDSKDIYNASLCAIKTADYTFAKICIQDLIKTGYSPDSLKSKTFETLPKVYRDSINNSFDSLNNNYKSKFDLKQKALYDSMDAEEQYYLKFRNGSGYDSLVLVHAKILQSNIFENGLPKVPMFPGRMKIPYALLRHHFGVMNKYKYPSKFKLQNNSLDFKDYTLQPLLLKAVLNGELSPQIYASCIDYNELDNNKSSGQVIIQADLQNLKVNIIYPDKDKLRVINKNRYNACLESFEDAVKKNPDINLLLSNYPFKEHLDLCKKLGMYKSTSDHVPIETTGEFVTRSLELQNKVTHNSELREFTLPESIYTFLVTLPDK